MELTIDLTKLKELSGKLDYEHKYELKLITNYRRISDADNNTMNKVVKEIAEEVSMNSSDDPYNVIPVFFNEKKFYTTLIKFHSMLEHLILKQIDPTVNDIWFDSVVSEVPYVVKFKYS